MIGYYSVFDGLGYFGGINLYTYVRNNPVNWTDPYGFENLPFSSSTPWDQLVGALKAMAQAITGVPAFDATEAVGEFAKSGKDIKEHFREGAEAAEELKRQLQIMQGNRKPTPTDTDGDGLPDDIDPDDDGDGIIDDDDFDPKKPDKNCEY